MAHRFKRVELGKVSNEAGDITLREEDSVYRFREAPQAYVFCWRGKIIGCETPFVDLVKDDRGLNVLVRQIEKFGEPGEVSAKLGIQPVMFESIGDRRRALLDAAEALLTLSNSHRKIHRPRSGYTVVGIGGDVFRMEDFGIVEEDLAEDVPTDWSADVGHRFRRVALSKVSTSSGDVTLEMLLTVFRFREPPIAWLLDWHGQRIGFETPFLDDSKDEFGRQVMILRIEKFGESGEVTKTLGLEPVSFASSGLKRQALLDAAEAMLTQSNYHRKDHPRTGYCVVEIGGRLFRMEDFGIIEANLVTG